ncbi:MAG TPA: OsmC family protein [Solirubrobacterales bacterium]|jgi:osmotically inducible protein OsmC|nr:OsmC family protein [Solirubrobacterales bacterium]
MATRNGSAVWRGDLEGGEGRITVGNGVHEGPYSFKSRFEDGEGTNPEELIAAAEAGCFTMAMSLMLSTEGHTPEELHTDARAVLRNVDGKPTITGMNLKTRGRVPGIDQETFQRTAERAKEECVISRALAGVEDFQVEATLES